MQRRREESLGSDDVNGFLLHFHRSNGNAYDYRCAYQQKQKACWYPARALKTGPN